MLGKKVITTFLMGSAFASGVLVLGTYTSQKTQIEEQLQGVETVVNQQVDEKVNNYKAFKKAEAQNIKDKAKIKELEEQIETLEGQLEGKGQGEQAHQEIIKQANAQIEQANREQEEILTSASGLKSRIDNKVEQARVTMGEFDESLRQ